MALFENKIQERPGTLRAVISQAVCSYNGRNAEEQFYIKIKSFLNLRFSIAKALHPNIEKELNELFKQCTEDN